MKLHNSKEYWDGHGLFLLVYGSQIMIKATLNINEPCNLPSPPPPKKKLQAKNGVFHYL